MASAAPARNPVDEAAIAASLVEQFLTASMVPDPVRARSYMSADVRITFTGGRRFDDPSGTAAFNAVRYRKVQKKFEATNVAPGVRPGEFVVYNIGTLYGEWPDGTPFEGNRYVDRFEVKDGKITRMDVWNDSAEILLQRAGLAQDSPKR
jgi:hypothetical protein